MLARKAGYIPYEENRGLPSSRRVAERKHFSRVIAQTLFIVFLCAFFLLLNVALAKARIDYGYTLMQEKRQIQKLQQENDDLKVDIARMESPERIYKIATGDLGMVVPSAVLYSQNRRQTDNTADIEVQEQS